MFTSEPVRIYAPQTPESKFGGALAEFAVMRVVNDPLQDEVCAPALFLVILQFSFETELPFSFHPRYAGLGRVSLHGIALKSRPEGVIEVDPIGVGLQVLGYFVPRLLLLFRAQVGSICLAIELAVSDRTGRIDGRVISEAKPVAGAPVFLWPVADSARRSVGGPLQALSDTEGRFHFDSLPPGDYRALASFDISEIDEDLLELSQATTVHAEAAQTATVDLGVWSPP